MFISVVDRRVYGRRKRYIKIHFAVDVRTREVVSMDVTTDDVHDSKVLPGLMIDTSMNRLIAEHIGWSIRLIKLLHHT